jgi:hypothetical protein
MNNSTRSLITSKLPPDTQAQQARLQKERLASALIERSRRISGCDDNLDLLTWTIRRRSMLNPVTPLNFRDHPYLVGIYRCDAQGMVIYKASQMGASEYAISYSVHAADERDATVLYIFPTDTQVSDFSTGRIGPAIEASPYLDSIIVEGRAAANEDAPGRRGADRVTLKRVRNRFLYLRGGQVSPTGKAAQLKSIDADVVVYDEVDEMDPRAPTIAEKRLGHSQIAEQRWISTPTYPGFGIHVKWLESDQREWFVRCEACGNRQPMTIDDLVTAWDDLGRPRAWHEIDGRPFIACRKCGKPLDRLSKGEWVATFPERPIAGFHLTKLFSRTASLPDILAALDTTDETERKEAFNQHLGEPYTQRGSKLDDAVLDACRRDYAHEPIKGERTVMGVDVGRVLHVVVRGPQHSETGERPQRFAGDVDNFDELGRMMIRFNVERAVIDALPETRKAREFQAAYKPGRVWLAYYVVQKTGIKKGDPAQWDAANGVVNLDRTRTLDATFSRFYEAENSLPAYARDIRDYYAHLKAQVRTLADGPGGEKVAIYKENGPDHMSHAENYCTVASMTPPVKRAGVWGR